MPNLNPPDGPDVVDPSDEKKHRDAFPDEPGPVPSSIPTIPPGAVQPEPVAIPDRR